MSRGGPVDSLRVLFLGNSFTAGHNIPLQVQALLTADGNLARFDFSTLTAGGAALAQWLNDKDGTVAGQVAVDRKHAQHADTSAPNDEGVGDDGARTRGIGEQGQRRVYDYVILQEQSNKPLKNYARYAAALRGLHEKARGEWGARTVVYETTPWEAWVGGREEKEFLHSTRRAVDALDDPQHVRSAPVGRLAAVLRARHPEIGQWMRDGRHPSPAIAFLAACAIAKALHPGARLGAAAALELPNVEGAKAAKVVFPTADERRCIAQLVSEMFSQKRAASEDPAESPQPKRRKKG